MTFKDVVNKELLFESKKNITGCLKVFYDINIKINDLEDPTPEQVPPEPAAPVAAEPAPVPTAPVTAEPAPLDPNAVPPVQQESVMTEEEVEKKIQGEVPLTKEDADNIQTIEDLIDFLADKKSNGENILDELTVEVITSLIGNPEALKASDIIKKEDQMIINLCYGYKKDNSVGFKILKRRGVNSVSVIMLKDNEILDGKFDIGRFNSQIIDYRNEWLKK